MPKMIETIHIQTWSQDRYVMDIYVKDEKGTMHTIVHEGYNPGILGHSDELYFEVDNATGQIIGWEPINLNDLDIDPKFKEDANEVD